MAQPTTRDHPLIFHILILGGYGNFGGILSQALASDANIRLTIAGRSPDKAQRFTTQNLQHATHPIQTVAIDAHAADLAEQLAKIAPDLVIHTSGPFQGQDYHVAKSCIAAGIHYIDLADARDFVHDFEQLDDLAKAQDVLAISGASTLPGLSSAVIQRFHAQFQSLEKLEYAITLANQSERGIATIQAILSYTGKPFTTLIHGTMQPVMGWQNLHQAPFKQPLGSRWLANCDVPDLELFPSEYPTLRTQRFYAGLELGIMHVGLWGLSWLVRMGLIANLARFSKPIMWLSERFMRFGSANSGMMMQLSGTGLDQQPLTIRWDLVALHNQGLMIPTIPALILARKMAADQITLRGAMPCIHLITLEEFSEAVADLQIQQSVTYRTNPPSDFGTDAT